MTASLLSSAKAAELKPTRIPTQTINRDKIRFSMALHSLESQNKLPNGNSTMPRS
jgi:hypothetical protein